MENGTPGINQLGDDIYDYIEGLGKYDEEETGKITGVLLESFEYAKLKEKFNNKAELQRDVEEISETLRCQRENDEANDNSDSDEQENIEQHNDIQEENGLNSEVVYVQPYGDTASVFNYDDDDNQVIVQFTESTYGADALKSITYVNGIPVEFVVYCDDESKDYNVFEERRQTNGGKMKSKSIKIPDDYNQPYYPYVIRFVRDFKLDNVLPIILPIPVNRNVEKYDAVFVDQYTGSNVNDRYIFSVSFKQNKPPKPEVVYVQPYGDTANIFSYRDKQIIVQFTDSSYGTDALKSTIDVNGIPVEFIVYCNDESNNENLFNQNLTNNKGEFKQYEVTIPNDYNQPYYPYVIGNRSDFNVDYSELPIIIPIPVNNGSTYNIVCVNPYYRGNINDRMRFIITA